MLRLVRASLAVVPRRALSHGTLAKQHLKQKHLTAKLTVEKWSKSGKLASAKSGLKSPTPSPPSAWPSAPSPPPSEDGPLEREIILDKPRRKRGKGSASEEDLPRGTMTKIPEVVPAHVWEAEVKAPTKKVVGLDLDDDEEDDYEDDDDDEELRGPLERYIEKEEVEFGDDAYGDDDDFDDRRFAPRVAQKRGPTVIPGSPLPPAMSPTPVAPKKGAKAKKGKKKQRRADEPGLAEDDDGEDMFDSVVGDDEVDAALMLSAHTAALTPRFDYRSLYRDYDAAERARIADAALALTTRSAQRAHWAQRMPWDPHVDTLNREVFGNTEFRPLQREAINALICGENVLCLLPSGGGKSLLYQLPALFGKATLKRLCRGAAIVVSPLLSLIQDQMAALKALGIPARTISSRLGMAEVVRTLQEMREEELKFKVLFVTPEKLVRSRPFVTALKAMHRNENIRLFAVDEAHCISEWGHDFRPDYRRLKVLKKYFPSVPTLAVTGSCTPAVRLDIQEQLGIEHAQLFQASVDRTNIKFEVRDRLHDDVIDDVHEYLVSEHLEKQCGIVFCLTRADAKRMARELKARGHNAAAYHAKLKADKRVKVQEQWMKGEVDIICSTVAFGLGINKPNVRFVLHATLPTSLEAYYQHVGRAGRDGLPSKSCLFFAFKDRSRVENVLSAILSEDGEVELDRSIQLQRREKLDDMVQYCLHEGCRREFMLRYFGEELKCDYQGDRCDMCAILRTRFERESRRAAIIAARNPNARPNPIPPTGLKPSPLYTAPRKAPPAVIQEAVLQPADIKRLEDAPLISDSDPKPVISLEEAVDIAYESSKSGVAQGTEVQPPPPPEPKPSPKASPKPPAKPSVKPPLKSALLGVRTLTKATESSDSDDAEDHQSTILSLAMRMKETDKYVKKIAEIAAARPGILSKNAIRNIARTRPTTFNELAAIKGVGKERASIFKDKILAVFSEEELEEE